MYFRRPGRVERSKVALLQDAEAGAAEGRLYIQKESSTRSRSKKQLFFDSRYPPARDRQATRHQQHRRGLQLYAGQSTAEHLCNFIVDLLRGSVKYVICAIDKYGHSHVLDPFGFETLHSSL
jgi:hypothetical protein